MSIEKCCVSHKKFDSLRMGRGIGSCDLGVVWAICDGDIKFCEKPDALRKFFFEKGKQKMSGGTTYRLPQARMKDAK